MSRYVLRLSVVIILSSWAAAPVRAASIPIENASFEAPAVDPNGFGAVPFVESWTEIDVDTEGSTNTGVFANTAAGSPDHVANADGLQLAFLGSQQGNALEQDLAATYKAGSAYRLTVGVGVSMRFPPSTETPVDSLELVLYYRDGDESVAIASQIVKATGLSTTQLQDFSVYLPAVELNDAWAGKTIGVAIRAAGAPGGFWDLDNVRLIESLPVSIPIENPSFESPVVDPNGFGAVPLVNDWTEIDLDTEASANTGVFANTAADSPDHIANADGLQLAFLGSQQGNALEQDLAATYKAGAAYRLTVGVGVSMRFPPSAEAPVDNLELVLYYRDGNEPVGVASQTVEATGLSTVQLQDFSVDVPAVEPNDAWAGKAIGVAIRAAGAPGGFWDLDNVRLTESLPVSIPIENPSFESPVVDPNGFGAVPLVDGWTEIDLDTEGSTNTGVFANTVADSPDHVANADGLQLAFLGSQQGNALEQDLAATYKAGAAYRLTVGVGVSMRFPPSTEAPVDNLELVLYYRDGNEPVGVASQTVEATGLSTTQLQDFSLYLPPVEPNDAWAGKAIGVAIRAAGAPGGFWDLDNVRLGESLPPADFTPPDKE
jgi:HpiC1 cyclase